MDLNTQELEHFVEAQDKVYANVLDEIAMGHKTSHWMWFIFPQLRELGRSAMAKRFGIAGRDEAMTYLAHPVLGPRLKECVHLLLSQRSSDAHEIFGSPDDLKLRSCLTLFASVTKEEPCFQSALNRFYAGKPDQTTVALLKMPT
jgi:uncharacterized protein (DUF1810 family)